MVIAGEKTGGADVSGFGGYFRPGTGTCSPLLCYIGQNRKPMKRNASAVWKGSGKDGQGHLDTQSGVFKQQPYSFKTRFQNEDGKEGTNPEELIGAAHAGCFAMALSFQLNEAGYTADELRVKATVHLDKEGEGFAIPKIELDLQGKVPNISEKEFMELAEAAKKGCPVSKVLNADISLNAKLNQ